LAALTWIGGGSNQARNPNDWIDENGSPSVPTPGGSLLVTGVGPFTMNIRGDDLAGNGFLDRSTGLTANLSHQANVSADTFFENHSTFNVTQRSVLHVGESRGNVTVNLSQHSTLNLSVDEGESTINISGHDTATIGVFRGGATVNVNKGGHWNGSFDGQDFGHIVVNGSAGAVFNNDAVSGVGIGGSATIAIDVIGTGSFDIAATPSGVPLGPSRMEFAKSVGPHQSVSDGGLLQIDQPNLFAATVTLNSAPVASEIDLEGLANADSYSYSGDILKIYSGCTVIDTLRLTDQTLYGFDVVKTSGSVNVVALASSGETLSGALPVHVGS
jgi:hypothetical protein